MLACRHEAEPFGSPLCEHLRTCWQPWLPYVKWYVGTGLKAELLCKLCAEAREKGLAVAAVETVCAACFEYATTEVGDQQRAGGQPEILVRSTEREHQVEETAIPGACGEIVDLAPIHRARASLWLMLSADGSFYRFDASGGVVEVVGTMASLPAEEAEGQPFMGHIPRLHLHASTNGLFAAVVNDYGRHGRMIDLQTGRASLVLDGGEHHPGTVPFSFAFAEHQGRVVAIHRTSWNRLDVSDAVTGKLLTTRDTAAQAGHHLDYFHGALYLSPGGTRLLDDGWVWHPVGVPTTWSLRQWLSDNVWESEDGGTRQDLCDRNYYWDHGMTWLDDATVAIGGIGRDDEMDMIDGVRIFDVSGKAREVGEFAGPAGRFFSDGNSLFSSSTVGLSRWDPKTGHRIDHIDGFEPAHQHVGAGELVQLAGRVLRRWAH